MSYTSLGRFLQRLRIQRNEVLRDMAKALDYTSVALSNLECGKCAPAPDLYNTLCRAYCLGEADASTLKVALHKTTQQKGSE